MKKALPTRILFYINHIISITKNAFTIILKSKCSLKKSVVYIHTQQAASNVYISVL